MHAKTKPPPVKWRDRQDGSIEKIWLAGIRLLNVFEALQDACRPKDRTRYFAWGIVSAHRPCFVSSSTDITPPHTSEPGGSYKQNRCAHIGSVRRTLTSLRDKVRRKWKSSVPTSECGFRIHIAAWWWPEAAATYSHSGRRSVELTDHFQLAPPIRMYAPGKYPVTSRFPHISPSMQQHNRPQSTARSKSRRASATIPKSRP